MAISYKGITWDIAKKTISNSAWAKNDTGRGLRVTIAADEKILIPEAEILKIRFKTLAGLDGSTAGVIEGDTFKIELDDVVLNRKNDVQVDLELTVSGKIISSPIFTIPVFKSIGCKEVSI